MNSVKVALSAEEVKVALSAEEKDRLDRDGFLVLKNFVAPGKLADLRRRITGLFAEIAQP